MPADSPPLRFPRRSRIRQGRDFARLKSQGRRIAGACLIANWQPVKAPGDSRVGVITSRKIGPAVTRNRARRLLREAFRLHQHEFSAPVDLVLVARNGIVGKRFADVDRDFQRTLQRAGLLPPPPQPPA
ncbi:MAG TPA: ribonuclease P protein component [Verrucomicrobiae bacterium]|nr:ribonuclease P protein component [Verrucomicrobiae bacterium]